MFVGYIFRRLRKYFLPKLDFHKDQIYFKDIALDFLKNEGYEPIYMKSEKEAKEFDFDRNLASILFTFSIQTQQGKSRMRNSIR